MADSSFRIYKKSSSGMSGMSGISNWLSESNHWIIVGLSILLLFALFDIRILNGLVDIVVRLGRLIIRFIWRLLMLAGIVTGNTIEIAGVIIGETGDVAETVGQALQSGVQTGAPLIPPSWDKQKQESKYSQDQSVLYSATPANTSTGVKWCLFGDQNAQKGCLKMNIQDKCMSGKSFQTSAECIGASQM